MPLAPLKDPWQQVPIVQEGDEVKQSAMNKYAYHIVMFIYLCDFLYNATG